jgi:hypothetical protein
MIMEKIIKILSSRTVWTVGVIVALSIVQSIEQFIPADTFIMLNSMLGSLAIYFRVNASVDFTEE